MHYIVFLGNLCKNFVKENKNRIPCDVICIRIFEDRILVDKMNLIYNNFK
jgi:hypothetical protein